MLRRFTPSSFNRTAVAAALSSSSCFAQQQHQRRHAGDFSSQIAQTFSLAGQRSIAAAKRSKLSTLQAELDKLNTQKTEIDKRCESRPNTLAALTFAYLTVQTGTLYYWVYDRFDWCLCEPITYLLGTAVVWIAIGFYLVTGGEYDWDVLRNLIIAKQRKKLYAAEKLDIVRIEELQREVQLLLQEVNDVEPVEECPQATRDASEQ